MLKKYLSNADVEKAENIFMCLKKKDFESENQILV